MILGVDFGESNIGLATSLGEIAEPYGTIAGKNRVETIKEIGRICREMDVELIIVGVSEGKSANEAVDFGNELASVLRLPVKFVDETLTSVEADTNVKRDKEKIHERSAAVILQRYLDSPKDYA